MAERRGAPSDCQGRYGVSWLGEHSEQFGNCHPGGGTQDSAIETASRRARQPQTFTTKADAGRWLSRTQADIERGEFVDPMLGKVALADYSALWISTRLVRGRPLSPRTIELYRWQLLKHILPTLRKIELRHLEASAVRGWFGPLSGPDGPGRPTAAKCYRLLRAIMQTAAEDGLVAKARTLAGLKGYVTNLQAPTPEFVLGAYHQLWQIEKSFRMSKSDLRARPI